MASRKRNPRHWPAADELKLVKLRDEYHLEWCDVAVRMGRGVSACKSRYYDLKHGVAGGMIRAANSPIKSLAEIYAARLSPVEQRREQLRDARIAAADARAQDEWANGGRITSTFFGDPPPGYSALDRKRKDQHA